MNIKYFFSIFLSIFIFSYATCTAELKEAKPNEIYSDQEIAKLITIITTTNPIPSIPNTSMIEKTQASLFQINAFKLCKKIIVFDGIQPGYESRKNDYQQYKINVLKLTKNNPYFSNTQLVFCKSWVHLAGAIREALKHVQTPYLFIHQHDFLLAKPFNLNALISTMNINPNIKHVRLNREQNTFFKNWDGPVDEVIEKDTYLPLCRTFGWSDNDHVTTLGYYRNFVLPKCSGKVAMEHILHPALQESILRLGKDEGQKLFGTYLYGNIMDGSYLIHLNGRTY